MYCTAVERYNKRFRIQMPRTFFARRDINCNKILNYCTIYQHIIKFFKLRIVIKSYCCYNNVKKYHQIDQKSKSYSKKT